VESHDNPLGFKPGVSLLKSMLAELLVRAALRSNEDFVECLKEVLKKLGVSLRDLSRLSGVSLSTLNKLLGEKRDVRLSTYRGIVSAVRKLEGGLVEGRAVAVVASRQVLDKLKLASLGSVVIRKYPAESPEEAVASAIMAERQGVEAVVCAPLLSRVLSKFLSIPIVPIGGDKVDIESAVKAAVALVEGRRVE